MPHAGADRELAVLDGDPVERRDAVDVDQMGRARQPERHGGDQALPARQHAAVLAARPRASSGDRLVDGLGRVILKRRGFHGHSPVGPVVGGPIIGTMIYF